MAIQTNNLDHLLATLGEARQNGAFSGGADGYPWQAKSAATQSRPQTKHARLWKVGPLAAAAAVAVLFVVPKFGSEGGSPIVSENVKAVDSTERPETLTPATSTPDANLDCDFDGDGVVNGLEIQRLIERMRNGEATVDQAEALTRCLLNG